MNHSKQITILSIAVAVLFVSVLFLLYLNFYKTPTLISTPKTGIIPTSVSISTSDFTAGWKTYNSEGMNFKYPSTWQLDTSGIHIISTTPQIDLMVFGKDGSMYNECMKLSQSKTSNGLFIKYYETVTSSEACSGLDNTPRQIWITKVGGDGFQPGIIYGYSSTSAKEAEGYFDQILSTFKFTP